MKTSLIIFLSLFSGVILGHFVTTIFIQPNHRLCRYAIKLKVEEVDSLQTEYDYCRKRFDEVRNFPCRRCDMKR